MELEKVLYVSTRKSTERREVNMTFTTEELRAMIEEYSKTTEYRKEYLSTMWEVAKEEVLHVQ